MRLKFVAFGAIATCWVPSAAIAADNPETENFNRCLIAHYDADKYTSLDGGHSAILMMGLCDWKKYVNACVTQGGQDADCTMQAASLSQSVIKLREASVK